MSKKKLSRVKAFLGLDGAIQATASHVNTAVQQAAILENANRQAKAAKDAAYMQVNAMNNAAAIQKDAIEKQTENNNKLQEQAINLNKEFYEKQRDTQRELQMNLQMLRGYEDTKTRNRSGMQVVKYGGRAKHKVSLRGSNNASFDITDGGGAEFKGYTPEGFELYKFVGDTHNQSHKLSNGKTATGIGVNIDSNNKAENADIEAEGGEYALATPNDILFLSKHNIGGFNPSKAVENGVNPIQAFNIQENIKNKAKRKLRLVGGNAAVYSPGILVDNDTPTGYVVTQTYNDMTGKNKLKYGGCKHARRRYDYGGPSWETIASSGNALMNSLGGLLSSNVVRQGNNAAARILSTGYLGAGNILASAYAKMKGIDLSLINPDDYAADHYLPAIRSHQVSIAPKAGIINRAANRQLEATNRRTLSSAAALNRYNNIERDRIQQLEDAYISADEQSERIKQQNTAAINEAAYKNAALDLQSQSDYNKAKLGILEYNADVRNQSIAGIGESLANALNQSSGVQASTLQANAQSLSNAINNGLNVMSSSFNDYLSRRYNLRNAFLGADEDARLNYTMEFGTSYEKENRAKYYDTLADNTSDAKLKELYKGRATALRASK